MASIEEARKFARSEMQSTYLTQNIEHFTTGSMQQHIDASISWVKDDSPPVETVIGFIESYRDPLGLRCEWEGLVAIQNEAETKSLKMLAQDAMKFIRLLPWCRLNAKMQIEDLGAFENSVFVKPDFMSMEGKLPVCDS